MAAAIGAVLGGISGGKGAAIGAAAGAGGGPSSAGVTWEQVGLPSEILSTSACAPLLRTQLRAVRGTKRSAEQQRLAATPTLNPIKTRLKLCVAPFLPVHFSFQPQPAPRPACIFLSTGPSIVIAVGPALAVPRHAQIPRCFESSAQRSRWFQGFKTSPKLRDI